MSKQKFAEHDFTIEDLPQTRREQFFDVLKNQYRVLFVLGVMLLLFFVLSLAKNCVIDYANNATYDLLGAEVYTEEQALSTLGFIWIISNLADIILYPIIFLGLSGAFRVIKQLVYGEAVIFKFDFKLGLKDNWKGFILVGALIAVFKAMVNIFAFFFDNSVLSKYGPLILFFIVILPILVMCLFYMTVYKNNARLTLKHSAFLYLRASWRFILVLLLLVGPYVLLEYFMNFLWVKQAIYVVLIVFVLPLALLISFMATYNVFDKVINVNNCPEIVRKGLYVSETEKEMIKKMTINEGN